jgi:hypothetical protein
MVQQLGLIMWEGHTKASLAYEYYIPDTSHQHFNLTISTLSMSCTLRGHQLCRKTHSLTGGF